MLPDRPLAAGEKQRCVAHPATQQSSPTSGAVAQLSPRAAPPPGSRLGALEEEAKQEEEGKGNAVYTARGLRRHRDLVVLNYQEEHVTNIMQGCLGLIFSQLGSQRAAALWDARNSFPLGKAGGGRLTAASH